MKQIVAFSDRLARAFQPERIILFGSHAYGTPHTYSDVDLLVIQDFRGNAFDRATAMLRRVRAPFSVDLLVRTHGDTARRYREFDPLIREALDRGKVLYESHSERVGQKGRGGLHQRRPRVPRSQVP